MTLKYRGITYQPKSININTHQTEVSAKYRGQSYQVTQSKVQVLRPKMIMTYRGVTYNQGENVTIPQPIQQLNTNCS